MKPIIEGLRGFQPSKNCHGPSNCVPFGHKERAFAKNEAWDPMRNAPFVRNRRFSSSLPSSVPSCRPGHPSLPPKRGVAHATGRHPHAPIRANLQAPRSPNLQKLHFDWPCRPVKQGKASYIAFSYRNFCIASGTCHKAKDVSGPRISLPAFGFCGSPAGEPKGPGSEGRRVGEARSWQPRALGRLRVGFNFDRLQTSKRFALCSGSQVRKSKRISPWLCAPARACESAIGPWKTIPF